MNATFVRCMGCNKRQLVDNCKKVVEGVIQVQKDAVVSEFKFDRTVFTDYFKKAYENNCELEEDILVLSKIDIKHTDGKLTIVS